MRTIARITIPVEAGNRAVSDGTIGKLMMNAAEQWRPEAMYFTAFEGRRSAYMVFDMQDSADLPAFAEPFFNELDAEVELAPVMNSEDLQRGLSQLG
ncbi:MAG TPA: DUF3303 family protein [Streptosporangiaceae bacterium]|nr:DUF3303 family protein [Streptosporangiaceae bacterium]